MKYSILCLAAVSLAMASCKDGGEKTTAKKTDVLYDHLDTTVSPRDDFFDYANGGWIKKNPIPADEASFGIGELVQRELYAKLRTINEEAEKKGEKSGSGQQIGDFWHSGMDSAAIEQAGIAPLKEDLERIASIKTMDDLLNVTAAMHRFGVNVFFSEGVGQDDKNSEQYAYFLHQGGLGMPIRDYYLNTDARTAGIRAAYPAYIARVLALTGMDSATAQKKAAGIMKFETALARSSRKLEELRDPNRNYNKYAIKDLKKIGPGTDWAGIIAKIGVKHVDSVIVGQPGFFMALDKQIHNTSIDQLKDYLTFHLVNNFAPYLSKNFVDAQFDFFGKKIRGAEEQRPRWRRVLDAEERVLGEALGQLFVKEYFTPQAKKRYEEVVENVRAAYRERLEKLTWMSDATRTRALQKLSSIKKKIGYPDKWKDLSSIKIDRGAYALNVKRATEWWGDYDLNKLGKPVDRSEWSMTPQTYNAYYNWSNNEIVLPAAMMTVPGYKDEELDDALVYGYTAASTVGHEITHGFDDEGRQYDDKGNLQNWWMPVDSAEFTKRAEVLVKQFDAMIPLDSMHINGKATLGENLADLGGILIGLDAFKKTDAYKKGEKISGLTPLQRFFLGYSLGWMMQQRKERIASQLLTDVHAPAKNRVNGPFPNVPEFYEAFGIKPGDKMYLPDSLRVRLW